MRDGPAFSDILDELIAEHAEIMQAARSPSIDHLAVAREPNAVSSADAAQAYFEAAADIAFVPDAPPVEPPTPLPTDKQSIVAELGLTGRETAAQLAAIRRGFALNNHPDRVCAALRDNAMTRMQVANALIDEAKANS